MRRKFRSIKRDFLDFQIRLAELLGANWSKLSKTPLSSGDGSSTCSLRGFSRRSQFYKMPDRFQLVESASNSRTRNSSFSFTLTERILVRLLTPRLNLKIDSTTTLVQRDQISCVRFSFERYRKETESALNGRRVPRKNTFNEFGGAVILRGERYLGYVYFNRSWIHGTTVPL